MRHFLTFLILSSTLFAEENFIVSDGSKILFEMGSQLEFQTTPACSFNIALCLMGLETGVIADEFTPVRQYQEGFDNTYEVWKGTHNPLSWMKHSVVWYSRLLSKDLGQETIEKFLQDFGYGNKDLTGGLTKAWISSSLKISPVEQHRFIERLCNHQLPLSERTCQIAKTILLKDETDGIKLYGKTGMGSYLKDGEKIQVGWLVGWVEKGEEVFPFAYNIHESNINDQRLKRVQQLLKLCGIYP